MNKYTDNNGNEIMDVGAPNSQAREDSKLTHEQKAAIDCVNKSFIQDYTYSQRDILSIESDSTIWGEYKAFLAGIAWERQRVADMLEANIKAVNDHFLERHRTRDNLTNSIRNIIKD